MKAEKVGKQYVFGLTVGLSLVISSEVIDRLAADHVPGTPLALKVLQRAVQDNTGIAVEGNRDTLRFAQTFCNSGSNTGGNGSGGNRC